MRRLSSQHANAGTRLVHAPKRQAASRGQLQVEARAAKAGVGLLGTKVGMTQLWDDKGQCHSCTVIGFESPNVVTQKFTKARDGRDAMQVGYKEVPEKNIKKPELGHCTKAGAPPLRHLVEWKVKDPAMIESYEVGSPVSMLELFEQDQLVDVAGVTIGKGTQGSIKRWGHAVGPMTHGSKSHRQHGSIGSGSATPSRVLPGGKHAGHMGNRRITTTKLKIIMIKEEEELTALVVRGSVPGKPGNLVEITPTKIVGVNC